MNRWIAVACFGLLGAAVAWAAPRLQVSHDITEFLPSAGDRELAELSREIAHSSLSRTATLTIRAADTEEAVAVGAALAKRLRGVKEIAWVRSGPDERLQQSFYDLYYPHRFGFIAADPGERASFFTAGSLRERVHELKRRLTSPMGPFLRKIAPADPWLLFVRHVERIRDTQQGALAVADGQLVAGENRDYAVILLASRASAFDGAASRRLQSAIASAFAEVSERFGDHLELEQAGIHRFAVRSEASIRSDITRVSVVGSVGVVVLVLALFGSLRSLALGALPMAGGMGAAVALSHVVFGELHGLTLAFGMTLIGVAIDYVAHFLSHHYLRPAPGGARDTMRRIWPGLLLGAATTVAGLVGLSWTSFPGLRQMALFTSIGVAASLLITAFLLPPFMAASPRVPRMLKTLGVAAEATLGAMERHRRLLWAAPAIAAVVCAIGLPRLVWEDDIRALSGLDPELVAEDARVRQRVARMDSGRFVIATGATADEALARNDRVHLELEAAAADGVLERHRSLHSLLWSPSLQRRNHESIPSNAWDRTEAALRAEGFVPELFSPFRDALEAPKDVLGYADVQSSPVGELARTFRVDLDDGVALLSFVYGVTDEAALRARVETVEGVRWFDQRAFMESAYGSLRTRTLELGAGGLVAVFLLVLVRYRRFGPALAAFVPALVASLTTLSVVALLGYEAHLLHVAALLLVLSMGVDYGVFMVESGRSGEGGSTLVGMLTACLSTVVSFGALAMSANPALRSMGLTAAIGVALALALAPAAWLLLGRRPEPDGTQRSRSDT
jgi:predicted exporter